MGAVYKKELKSYFSNMTGYISVALILVMSGIFVKLINFESHYPSMEMALPTVALILMLAVPIVTMKSFAEERHQKTDLLLYTLPLKTSQIVMGKYLAMMTVFAIPTVIMAFYPLIMTMYGKVALLATYASLLAFYLLCGAMVAVCMFMSSLTESQVIAAVLGVTALVVAMPRPCLPEHFPIPRLPRISLSRCLSVCLRLPSTGSCAATGWRSPLPLCLRAECLPHISSTARFSRGCSRNSYPRYRSSIR